MMLLLLNIVQIRVVEENNPIFEVNPSLYNNKLAPEKSLSQRQLLNIFFKQITKVQVACI